MVVLVAILILLYISQVVLAESSPPSILVVGSINADTFLPVLRLPTEGENITLRKNCVPTVDVPGGKGCCQAVAAKKLLTTKDKEGSCEFVGQFGNDAAAIILRKALTDAKVDLSHCAGKEESNKSDIPSGRGYVFITESGSVSAVVCGGSNTAGWKEWERAWSKISLSTQASSEKREAEGSILSNEYLNDLLSGKKCVMLQREVPEYVNLLIATEAKKRGILVIQDIGGEDRPMHRNMIELCDYLMPNESELWRLVKSFNDNDGKINQDDVIGQARLLQKHGARNVLVTRGSKGSMLVSEDSEVVFQFPCRLDPSKVVDETGAGDCYRAAFVVALLEGQSPSQCMEFASAAGACAVTKEGAVPSTPTREEVESMLAQSKVSSIPRGGSEASAGEKDDGDDTIKSNTVDSDDKVGRDNKFPLMFGSRLNSMKDRPELWSESLEDARDWVKRQSTVKGLTCVDFNYPQHFHTWKNKEAKAALDEVGLVAGAVCLRYPKKFARGAMNHPDAELRREAIDLTKKAAEAAIELGCKEVVVWSAYDGYDYPFQVDYDEKWKQLVEAFQECCDEYPNIKFSLEFKPTDENTRFFTVPSTGAALLLVKEIDRPNMGLTLDVGHMLMAGENPAQSIAMVGGKKLFGIQLNDGYTRLAAEDGMMFGSIHPSMSLEIIYQLQRIKFRGHLYFDTFPQRTDPVKEAEYNINRVKKFWYAAKDISKDRLQKIMKNHDAIEALNLVNESLRKT